MVRDYRQLAQRVLEGALPSPEELRALLAEPDARLPEILESAFAVRQAWFGRRVRLQLLVNAKSGRCGERCGYCSQSKGSRAPIPKYPLISDEELLDGARRAHAARACRYCIVASGRMPTDREVDRLCAVVGRIRRELPLAICCSLGMVSAAQAARLRDAGVTWMNHNTNTSRSHYARICSSHDYADRVRTIRTIKEAGLNVCSGGIVGLGESDENLVDMALACRALDVDAIPVNFFYPIAGTALAQQPGPSAARCLKALCLFRFANPDKEVRVAAGRELYLGGRLAETLQPASGLFVEGYLTTPGDSAASTQRLIEQAGFTIDERAPGASGTARDSGATAAPHAPHEH